MAQQKREKELNANNSNNNASGDFNVNEGTFGDDCGNFQYPNGYYYGPGGDSVQQHLPPADIYYVGDGMGERRRQRSDSRGISRRHARQTSSNSRRRVSQRRSAAARNEAFVHAVSN